MTISELRIKNFKKIDDLSLTFKNGINVIHGKNEIGKSSIIEAINRVFLTEPGASNREILKLIPWNTEVRPFVKIKFDNNKDETYSIEKTFNKGSGMISLFAGGREKLIAEGAKIQEKIFEKIGVEGSLESLMKLLWIDQGGVFSVFDDAIPLEAKTHIKDIIKENMVSKELEAFYGNLLVQYDAFIDKRNGEIKRTCEYFRLNEECRKAEAESLRISAQLNELEENINVLALIDRKITELNDKLKTSEVFSKNLEIKKAAIENLKAKEQTLGPVKKDYTDVLRLNDDIASKQNDLEEYSSHKKFCLQKKLDELKSSEKVFVDSKKRLEEINEELSSLKSFDERLLDEYERLLQETEKARFMLDGSSVEIRIKPAREISLKIKIDDEAKNFELSEPSSFTAAGNFTLFHDDFNLEVLNSSGKFDAAALKKELASKNKRVGELSVVFGGADLKKVKERNKKINELANERQRLEDKLKSADALRINDDRLEIGKELLELKNQTEISKADIEKIGRQSVDNYLKFLNNKVVELNTKIEGFAGLKSSILKTYGGFDELKNVYLVSKDRVDSMRLQIESLKPEKISSVTDRDINGARAEIDEINNLIKSREKEKTIINTRLENYFELQNEKARLEALLESLRSKLCVEKTTLNALKLLISLIDEEKKLLEESILDPLEKKIIDAFSMITNNKYTGISINDNFKLSSIDASVVTGNASVNHETLSFGTREQLAFLFRLAIADFLSAKGCQLMILDDSFVNTDDGRLKMLIEIMKSYSDRIQFLIFTCRDDYDDYRNEFNFIDLDKMIDN